MSIKHVTEQDEIAAYEEMLLDARLAAKGSSSDIDRCSGELQGAYDAGLISMEMLAYLHVILTDKPY